MKQLHEVVAKRHELKSELSFYESEKADLLKGRNYSELEEHDKKELFFLNNVISKLRVQIDALTYVINYDSKLQDVTIRPMMERRSN